MVQKITLENGRSTWGDTSNPEVLSSIEKQFNSKIVTIDGKEYRVGGATPSQAKKIGKVMHEFKEGKLHSGSKHGPVVKKRKQAVAIALSEAGLTKKAEHGYYIITDPNMDTIEEGTAQDVIDKANNYEEGNDFTGDLEGAIEYLYTFEIQVDKKQKAEHGIKVEAYDEEKYPSERNYLKTIITKYFGPMNIHYASADWGGIPNWTIKGDKFEGTFIIIDDNNKVVLMTREFDAQTEETLDNDLAEAEPNDTKALEILFEKAMLIKEGKSRFGSLTKKPNKFGYGGTAESSEPNPGEVLLGGTMESSTPKAKYGASTNSISRPWVFSKENPNTDVKPKPKKKEAEDDNEINEYHNKDVFFRTGGKAGKTKKDFKVGDQIIHAFGGKWFKGNRPNFKEGEIVKIIQHPNGKAFRLKMINGEERIADSLKELDYNPDQAEKGTQAGTNIRTETQQNNFGKSFKLGDKFKLHNNMSFKEGVETAVVEILPSGLFFKVDKSNKTFSIKTLHSKGSSYTSGQYLVPIAKEGAKTSESLYKIVYSDGTNEDNKQYTKQEVIDFANTSSYYERMDNDEPEMTTFAEAKKYIQMEGDLKVVKIASTGTSTNEDHFYSKDLSGRGIPPVILPKSHILKTWDLAETDDYSEETLSEFLENSEPGDMWRSGTEQLENIGVYHGKTFKTGGKFDGTEEPIYLDPNEDLPMLHNALLISNSKYKESDFYVSWMIDGNEYIVDWFGDETKGSHSWHKTYAQAKKHFESAIEYIKRTYDIKEVKMDVPESEFMVIN